MGFNSNVKRLKKAIFAYYTDGEHQVLRTQGIKMLQPEFYSHTPGAFYAYSDANGHECQSYITINGFSSDDSSIPYTTVQNGITFTQITSFIISGSNTVITLKKAVDSTYYRIRLKSFVLGSYATKKYGELAAYTADDQSLTTGVSSGFDFKFAISTDGTKLIVPTTELTLLRAIYFKCKVL